MFRKTSSSSPSALTSTASTGSLDVSSREPSVEGTGARHDGQEGNLSSALGGLKDLQDKCGSAKTARNAVAKFFSNKPKQEKIDHFAVDEKERDATFGAGTDALERGESAMSIARRFGIKDSNKISYLNKLEEKISSERS